MALNAQRVCLFYCKNRCHYRLIDIILMV